MKSGTFLDQYDLVYNKYPSVDRQPTIRRLRNFEIEYGLADCEMIRSWLSICEESLGPSSLFAPKSALNSLNIHLIDVTTRSIVISNIDVRYIALSYVWGQQNGVGESTQAFLGPFDLAANSSSPLPKFLPPKVAQTIEDAMFVVAKLGTRFLWVDAYCIEQSDPSEREHMINNMHQIYENAYLTICAISSSTSRSGLAGVSLFFNRRTQFTSYTGTESLIAQGGRNGNEDLEESPWIKRAWTLQEAVMSQRRLYFGESGLTLWSREELFHDYITLNTSENRWLMKYTLKAVGPSPPFSLEFTPLNNWDFNTYVRLVKDYARRKPSVASDASRAIASLLTRISSDTGTDFVFGLPARNIVQALLWQGSQLRRNEGFPSWSWLGWQGDISYREWLNVSYPGRLSSGTIFFGNYRDVFREKHHIVPFSAAAFSSRTRRSGSLILRSQLAHYKITLALRDGDLEHFPSLKIDEEPDSRVSIGDKWELLSGEGEPLHGVEHGFRVKYGFYVGADTSNRITHAKLEPVDTVLLQRWTEIDEEVGGIQDFSGYPRDRVWLVVLLRKPDGTAERASLLHLPWEHWTKANPHSATVCLV